MTFSIFTYGTLVIPEVMEAVTGYTYHSIEASAKGYARLLLQGKIYPGMIVASGHTTEGRLYTKVEPHSLALLDRFEDEIYVRQPIQVQLGDQTWVEAQAYIIPPEHQQCLTTDSWELNRFRLDYLTPYLAACRAFHSRESRRADSPR